MVSRPEGRVQVLLTLRADFYDRALLVPGFAEAFSASAVDVTPLSGEELERAVVEPARRMGVGVEGTLVAELVADMREQPGALPLFQYALTEVFEQAQGSVLTLDTYRDIGGLGGALTRRAERLFERLGPGVRDAARQVFLRLSGVDLTRRRVAVRELLDLELDPVAVQEVLDRFGSHRLLTFDRDPATGAPTVEVAHEALLTGWDRLRDWIEDHRGDLDRQRALRAAVREWEASGRHPDYLLGGDRLSRYRTWRSDTDLRLTRAETAFLDASEERARTEQAAEEARRVREDRMARRARRRLWGMAAALALLAATATFAVLATRPEPLPELVLVYEGRDDASYGAMIAEGMRQVSEELGMRVGEVAGPFWLGAEQIGTWSERGVPLIVTASVHAPVVSEVAPAHPDVHYVVIDVAGEEVGGSENVTGLVFEHAEGSFLVGAAAALRSRTGVVGFVGGVDYPLIHGFQAGFEAGARHADPDVEVLVVYLSDPPDFSGFQSPTLGAMAAASLYEEGADVVYHAAGSAGAGLFEVARAMSATSGTHLWAIGVDSDQYHAVEDLQPQDFPGVVDAQEWRERISQWRGHILTSMVKRLDVGIRSVAEAHRAGTLRAGTMELGLAEGGVDYSVSGGHLDDLVPALEALREDILAGRIEVPERPDTPGRLLWEWEEP